MLTGPCSHRKVCEEFFQRLVLLESLAISKNVASSREANVIVILELEQYFTLKGKVDLH